MTPKLCADGDGAAKQAGAPPPAGPTVATS